jgi:hypothetical protein
MIRINIIGTLIIFLLVGPSVSIAQTKIPLSKLKTNTHFHGIAFGPVAGSPAYLATHHGFFTLSADGLATRVSTDRNDYMGFTPHPKRLGVLFASGHPLGGGNMGFIVSRDAGRTWRQLSPGARGPVDFHQMDVSKANPKVIYGAFGGLQASVDDGKTWKISAPLPAGLIDLSASAIDSNRIYAATKGGLLYSTDGGENWRPGHKSRSATTLVQTDHKGGLYTFIIGLGLLRSIESDLSWKLVSSNFGDRYLLHLAVDPNASQHLYAVTQKKEV